MSTVAEGSFHFPPGFLWGAATAAHQVEGDKRANDWWAFEQAGKLPFKSGDACRHYILFEKDFDLAKAWGHNAHRFSIEWSRIEPWQGVWDLAAVDHYREVIQALRRRGMEPVVTLHHFTNPVWFAAAGGWLVRRNIAHFARYVEFVAGQLGDQVRWWLTINEPTVYAKNAFVTASGRRVVGATGWRHGVPCATWAAPIAWLTRSCTGLARTPWSALRIADRWSCRGSRRGRSTEWPLSCAITFSIGCRFA